MNLNLVILSIFAFFIGGIPVGKILVYRLKKIDIQKIGSGNIGSTNVKRILGLKWAFVVFILDFLKAFLPTLLASFLTTNFYAIAIVGLSAILGHIFSPYLKFRGGKGVATSLGVVMVFNPILTIISIVLVLIMAKITSKMSVGTLLGLLIFIIGSLFTGNLQLTFLIIIISCIIIFTHRSNIKRLISGKELTTNSKN